MNITLDVVLCQHIPIKGKLMDHEKKISEEMGVQLMIELLGVTKARAIDDCHHHFGAFINIPFLKQ